MKKVVTNVLTIVIIVGLLVGGFIIYRNYKRNKQLKQEYSYVVKKFSKKSELVVADAAIQTSAKKTFTSDATKDWPTWTQPIVKAFVGRTIEMKIPVKTEFKIQLMGLNKSDINIDRNYKLTFNKPLTVNVDSQIEGEIELINSSSGILDKAADVLTSGKSSQDFFIEKSQDTVYSTSEFIIKDEESIKKVVKYSEEALENVLNLSSDKKIDVVLTEKDLVFVNVDPKAK